jgi:hypothetical protein
MADRVFVVHRRSGYLHSVYCAEAAVAVPWLAVGERQERCREGIAVDTDEVTTIDDPVDAAWVAEQRQVVMDYLVSQRCVHSGVSVEPRWFVSPYVALWAIRSKTDPDRVGWWAISGDLPTDYLSASADFRTSGDVLMAIAHQWRAAAEKMREGKQIDGYTIGASSQGRELAPLLRSRADLLQSFGEQLNADELADE